MVSTPISRIVPPDKVYLAVEKRLTIIHCPLAGKREM
jgi:hypothetical protein